MDGCPPGVRDSYQGERPGDSRGPCPPVSPRDLRGIGRNRPPGAQGGTRRAAFPGVSANYCRPVLSEFDVILVSTSAGKDSQAMLVEVVTAAKAAGVLDRVVAVYCDLGPRVAWPGSKELAAEHCAALGIPLRVISREKGDLLDQVEARGMWPDNANRFCTSDQKRDQVAKLLTALVRELEVDGRRVSILNCLGFRAEESASRAKHSAVSENKRQSNSRRLVVDWLPIHSWTEAEVWSAIAASGLRHHPAYDLGMPRLSCMFCIFAPKAALVVAGRANPEALAEYVRVEAAIGHDFRKGFKIASVAEAIAAGETVSEAIPSWSM